MRNQEREREAKLAADYLRRRLGDSIKNTREALVLGTGWGEALELEGKQEVPFKFIPGFDTLQTLEGHARKVVCGKLAGKPVIALSGRVHLNESPAGEDVPRMVRLQVEMLFKLGVTTLILTNAAGSLNNAIGVGHVVAADGFLTLSAPTMPLWGGEFCSPEDTLHPWLREYAKSAAIVAGLEFHEGGYAMVRGPYFEGRKYDKQNLRERGAAVVGMSTVPEACIAALYGVEVLALSFVTNTDSEEHSHEENMRRAKASSTKLGKFLQGIVERF